MMDRSSDTTTLSPTPFSPFSSVHSFGSEGGTSDEPADLGQLAAVFEVFRVEQQPHLPSAFSHTGTPTSSLLVSASDEDPEALQNDFERTTTWSRNNLANAEVSRDEAGEPATVWSHHTLSDYLLSSVDKSLSLRARGRSLSAHGSPVNSDTEGEADNDDNGDLSLELDGDVSPAGGIDQPSLGYLDGVLGFLAAERVKFVAQREAGVGRSGGMSGGGGGSSQSQASAGESAWRHVIEPRRKRRRKRGGKHGTNGTNSAGPASAGGGGASGHDEMDGEAEEELSVSVSVSVSAGEADEVVTPVGDLLDGSSSGPDFGYKMHGKSMPSTPPRILRKTNGKERGKDPLVVTIPGTSATIPVHPKLSHSRSTPSLRLTIPSPPDARVLRLRTLATKLRMLFVEDAKALSSVLLNDAPEDDGFIDPRGRPPEGDDTLVHVFIDHSNILIGFLNHLRRYPVHPTRRAKTHMSHAALALILERGRPISRRVLATSSPLYQPMERAERLGYEVRVYARVPDLGDGADRVARVERERERELRERELVGYRSPGKSRRNGHAAANGSPSTKPVAAAVKGHSRKTSSGAAPDSDPGAGVARPPSPGSLPKGHSRSTSLTNTTQGMAFAAGQGLPSSSSNPNPTLHAPLGSPHSNATLNLAALSGRIRYREQGVDELLQLKLHQALADAETPPPPGATIVLATGDGNVGQFNEEGFRGCVRTALKKGWRVELYAWELGLSKAWVKEFGNGSASTKNESPYGDRFRIVGLEKFAQDLLEIP